MKNLSKICAVFLLSSALLCSCSLLKADPIIPVPPKDQKASFDGNAQDSGIVEATAEGFIVTARFVDRYNAMIDTYGSEPEFLPPLVKNTGVTPAPADIAAKHPTRGPLSLMSKQAMVWFIKLNQWRKMGRVPAAQSKPGVVSRVINAVIPASP